MAQKTLMRGLLHVHTTFSYDGEIPIEQLAQMAKARGLEFIAITEHDTGLTPDMQADLVAACQDLSDDHLLILPGLELNCQGGHHLLAFGMETLPDGDDPVSVAKEAREPGAVVVLAHPTLNESPVPDALLHQLHGVEVWNQQYDGRVAPNPRAVERLLEWRAINPSLRAFCGSDLHGPKHFACLQVVIDRTELRREKLLEALANGTFRSETRFLTVPSHSVGGKSRHLWGALWRSYRLGVKTRWHWRRWRQATRLKARAS